MWFETWSSYLERWPQCTYYIKSTNGRDRQAFWKHLKTTIESYRSNSSSTSSSRSSTSSRVGRICRCCVIITSRTNKGNEEWLQKKNCIRGEWLQRRKDTDGSAFPTKEMGLRFDVKKIWFSSITLNYFDSWNYFYPFSSFTSIVIFTKYM